MENVAKVILPEWDEENLRPKSKMPNCPRCGEDELGMLGSNEAFCYWCGLTVDRKKKSAA